MHRAVFKYLIFAIVKINICYAHIYLFTKTYLFILIVLCSKINLFLWSLFYFAQKNYLFTFGRNVEFLPCASHQRFDLQLFFSIMVAISLIQSSTMSVWRVGSRLLAAFASQGFWVVLSCFLRLREKVSNIKLFWKKQTGCQSY